jgi:hypothetical protein
LSCEQEHLPALPTGSVILHNKGNSFKRLFFNRYFYFTWFIDPLPSLPPGGKEQKTFPPWGKMKGGKILKIGTEICYRNYEV